MLNVYTFNKKTEEQNKLKHQESMKKTWGQWKIRNSTRWIDNYRKRVEKFVVDVNFYIYIG